jgi:peptide/nickel transport system permease protein
LRTRNPLNPAWRPDISPRGPRTAVEICFGDDGLSRASTWKELRGHAIKVFVAVLLAGFLSATLVRFAPGFGVDEEDLDTRLSDSSKQALRQSEAMNQSLPRFYLSYVVGMLHGELGTSKTLNRPVAQLLAERFPETLESVGLGLLSGWTLGLAAAFLSVLTGAWYLDLFSSMFSGLLLCVPAAVLALLFVLVQAPPRLILGLIVFPKIYRYARGLLKRAATMPHVITARAKGLSGTRVLLWHILPVVAAPLLALAGISISAAFTAAIPVEALCDLPGIGQLAWKAALGRDLPVLVNVTMMIAVVTLVANAASDFLGHSLRTVEA